MRDTTIIDLLGSEQLSALVVEPAMAAVLTVPPDPVQGRTPGAASTAWLVGEIDVVTTAQAHRHLRSAFDDGSDGPAVLDLARVTFMDLTGLRMLLALDEELAGRCRQLVLRAPSASVRLLVRVTGAQDALTVSGESWLDPDPSDPTGLGA